MSNVSDAGCEMAAGFRYVLDVYRNTSRMLLACDALLEPYGFAPYTGWAVGEGSRRMVDAPKGWLQARAARQYYPPGRKDREILTVGALFCDADTAEPAEPLCVASMMAVSSCPDAVYWLGMMGAWVNPRRGAVSVIDKTSVKSAGIRGSLDKYVRDSRLLSIEVPLLEITSSSQVEERLIKPLVAALEKSSAGGYIMPALPATG